MRLQRGPGHLCSAAHGGTPQPVVVVQEPLPVAHRRQALRREAAAGAVGVLGGGGAGHAGVHHAVGAIVAVLEGVVGKGLRPGVIVAVSDHRRQYPPQAPPGVVDIAGVQIVAGGALAPQQRSPLPVGKLVHLAAVLVDRESHRRHARRQGAAVADGARGAGLEPGAGPRPRGLVDAARDGGAAARLLPRRTGLELGGAQAAGRRLVAVVGPVGGCGGTRRPRARHPRHAPHGVVLREHARSPRRRQPRRRRGAPLVVATLHRATAPVVVVGDGVLSPRRRQPTLGAGVVGAVVAHAVGVRGRGAQRRGRRLQAPGPVVGVGIGAPPLRGERRHAHQGTVQRPRAQPRRRRLQRQSFRGAPRGCLPVAPDGLSVGAAAYLPHGQRRPVAPQEGRRHAVAVGEARKLAKIVVEITGRHKSVGHPRVPPPRARRAEQASRQMLVLSLGRGDGGAAGGDPAQGHPDSAGRNHRRLDPAARRLGVRHLDRARAVAARRRDPLRKPRAAPVGRGLHRRHAVTVVVDRRLGAHEPLGLPDDAVHDHRVGKLLPVIVIPQVDISVMPAVEITATVEVGRRGRPRAHLYHIAQHVERHQRHRRREAVMAGRPRHLLVARPRAAVNRCLDKLGAIAEHPVQGADGAAPEIVYYQVVARIDVGKAVLGLALGVRLGDPLVPQRHLPDVVPHVVRHRQYAHKPHGAVVSVRYAHPVAQRHRRVLHVDEGRGRRHGAHSRRGVRVAHHLRRRVAGTLRHRYAAHPQAAA